MIAEMKWLAPAALGVAGCIASALRRRKQSCACATARGTSFVHESANCASARKFLQRSTIEVKGLSCSDVNEAPSFSDALLSLTTSSYRLRFALRTALIRGRRGRIRAIFPDIVAIIEFKNAICCYFVVRVVPNHCALENQIR